MLLPYCRRKYIDADDCGVHTTRDLLGDINRVDEHLTEAEGFGDFLRWSPEGNFLVSCCENIDTIGLARQEAKIGKFGLLDFFTKKRNGGIYILGSVEEKQETLRRLVYDSGFDAEEQADIGDRPSSELDVGVELGMQVYRMVLLNKQGRPEGKYAHEVLRGKHFVVNTWTELRLKFPNLGPQVTSATFPSYALGARQR